MRILKVIPPSTPGACSGKYQTYLIKDPKCQSAWKIVCGSGGNGGHRFEYEVLRSLKSLINGKTESKYPAGMKMAKAICSKLGITNPKTQLRSVAHVANHSTTRTVDFAAKSPGIGATIADLGLELKSGKKIYVSLKAKNAVTIASIGAVGCFCQSGNRIVQTDKHQTVNNLLRYLAADVSKITQGLTNAKNKTRTKAARSEVVLMPSKINSSHRKLLRQFLVNAIGFGYYSASQNARRQSSFKFISRRTAQRMVGTSIKSVVLSYPRYYSEKDSSKQLSAWVITDKTRFKIELRNTHGNILPREIKVSILGLHSKL